MLREANGLAHTSPGQRPGNRYQPRGRVERQRRESSAYHDTRVRPASLVPHITFVEVEVILAKQLPILLLEGFCPMMLLLGVNVMNQLSSWLNPTENAP